MPAVAGRRVPGCGRWSPSTSGDRVTHSAWGLGTVVSTSGEADKARARIDFGGDVGVKELLLRYAPVEKL